MNNSVQKLLKTVDDCHIYNILYIDALFSTSHSGFYADTSYVSCIHSIYYCSCLLELYKYIKMNIK